MPFESISYRTAKRTDDQLIQSALAATTEAKVEVSKGSFTTILGGEALTLENVDSIASRQQMSLKDCYFHLNTGGYLRIARQNDLWTDEVQLTWGKESKTDARALQRSLEIVAAIKQHIPEFQSRKVLSDFLGEDSERHFAARESELNRLEQMAEKTFDRMNQHVLELTRQHEEKQQELDRTTEDRRKQLESQYAAKMAELQTAEEELGKRRKDQFDRESKWERRETFQKLLSKLDTTGEDFKFRLTPETRKMRWPIYGLALLLLALLLTASIYFMYHETVAPSTQPWAWVRPSTFSLVFVVTFGFFLRWQNEYAQRHAKEEFRLKRMHLDVLRANILVEMALEWLSNPELKGEMPPGLLETLGRNLFRDDGMTDRDVPPVDTLASALLGSAAQAKLKLGDNELSFDRKSLSEMQK